MKPPPCRVAVVIPCYKVTGQILQVIAAMPSMVERVYVVDDHCPLESGALVEQRCTDPRVHVLRHTANQGVGGAVITGYRQALEDGMDIVVKVDGDGQMDPALIPAFIAPIANGKADYTKGNRFFSPTMVATMPKIRLLGNAMLSFVNKVVSGYWSIMDPTNGYTAISTRLLPHLELDKLERRYFFESDMLFRLSLLRSLVVDIPMHAHYGEETSHLSIAGTALKFPGKYLSRLAKRFLYNYLLRDFNPATLQTLLGLALILAGGAFGGYHWIVGIETRNPASSGTVMLAALPIIIGVQLLLAAMQYDMQNQPRQPVHPSL